MGLFDKKAVIIRDNQKGEIDISEEFQSVNYANHGLSVDLQNKDAIVISKGVNDFDGSEITALEKLGDNNSRIWGEIDYHVIPTSELND